MLQIRHALSYGALFFLLFIFLFYGAVDSLRSYLQTKEGRAFWDSPHESKGKANGKTNYIIPDFSQYVPLSTLSSREFPLDDPSKRVLVIGDIHGEIKPFRKLLRTLNYSHRHDVLVHVGDIISKGPLEGSLAVLDFMANNNITGVRGNHDQKVIEWRGWLKWISTISRASQWLNNLEKQWHEEQANEDDDIILRTWLRRARKSASREDKSYWQLVPNDWLLFDDHYSIARDMSDLQYQYLLKLPLRLYIPSAHVFIVHAGLLPYNPHYPVDDASKQPLARLPDLPPRKNAESSLKFMDNNFLAISNGDLSSSTTRTSRKYDRKIDELRNLQEIALLTEIPQNTDPWVTLNIRSVFKGEVKRKSGKGRPWPKIWEEHMESCIGYDKHNANKTLNHYDDNSDQKSDEYDELGLKRLDLLCYPSTTIYGHSAARGLNVKRWSFGLDSACIYNKKLSALVIPGKETKRRMRSDEYIENVDSAILKNKYNIPFGDHSFAKTVSVKC